MTAPEKPIGIYRNAPPRFQEYDPRAPEVARLVAQMIQHQAPGVTVEHVGSTSVPGLAGKGIIDLMVLYPRGALDDVKQVLAALGFQRQSTGHLFPEERPMRVGAFVHAGREYRLHVHVLAADAQEAAELRKFRDLLRTDAELCASYMACKRRILNAGVSNPVDYSRTKGRFVEDTLTPHRPGNARDAT